MQAKFRINDPRILLEAGPGEMFVPMGPNLVECVCALRCVRTGNGVQLDVRPADRLNPDAELPVVVLACRASDDDPEYYPPGYQTSLPGAAPIVFLRQTQPAVLAPREARGVLRPEHVATAQL